MMGKAKPNTVDEEVDEILEGAPEEVVAPVEAPNNFEAEIKTNTNNLRSKTVVEYNVPEAKPVYRETKKELSREKAPKYMYWYEIDGLTGAQVLPNSFKYSPVGMIALTMDKLFQVVESGFTAYWKHASYLHTFWFNRPITKDNVKEFAWYINTEVQANRLKLSELDKGTDYYSR
jgi:hypothetical protein|nr:MAG TPA: hypothetical protein [Caudoviricetes sp.]